MTLKVGDLVRIKEGVFTARSVVSLDIHYVPNGYIGMVVAITSLPYPCRVRLIATGDEIVLNPEELETVDETTA